MNLHESNRRVFGIKAQPIYCESTLTHKNVNNYVTWTHIFIKFHSIWSEHNMSAMLFRLHTGTKDINSELLPQLASA